MASISLRCLHGSRARLRRNVLANSKENLLYSPRPLRCLSSTTSQPKSQAPKLIWYTSITLLSMTAGALYITDTRASIHRWLAVPMLNLIYPDVEDAHCYGNIILRGLYSLGLHPRERNPLFTGVKDADLSVSVFNRVISNPIGTSAGVDKLAEIPDILFALGPAVVEVGGVTPFAQEGNPRPRVFKLPKYNALINRCGLAGKGAEDMAQRLRERVQNFAYKNGYGSSAEAVDFVLNGGAGVPPGSLKNGKLLAVQIAKNRDTNEDDIDATKRDYVYCVEKVAQYADILVVNVSSPNTPGLRTLQRGDILTELLRGIVEAAKLVPRKTTPRIMVKVSPDEDGEDQVAGIVDAIWKSGVDGVIVSNTTRRRDIAVPDKAPITPKDQEILKEQGGLSGPMLFNRTLRLVKRYRDLLDRGPPSNHVNSEKLSNSDSFEPKVIFASGGITNGKEALEILNAGASVAQIYTAMVYGGAGTVTRIKQEMRQELSQKQKAITT
ncbi:BgTH12-03176 [Blumeria graminis f. sp. triticale]|uniref:Dihydroorotate dehydrogenase (quinone), mitochondrial n=1 Tax=Blumeria graminis f. sp. triticale TaxID=1689686 RepID=A0A9W4GFE9_BLUGR|nr:BgTH12-03176 [Blumeria graminis f. sp. triticale]